MEKITENVYLQRYTAGAVGAINTTRGLVCVDAPLLMEESRLWRGELMRLRSGSDRLVVLLDMHPDRALGIRNMDLPVLSHEYTMRHLAERPVTYRSEGSTGAYVDTTEMSGSYRWPQVDIAFSDELQLTWDERGPIRLLHRPGPRPEAIWVVWEAEKVVFVGDAVLHSEPPFLAEADLPAWIESLNDLLTDRYRHFAIIGSRDGALKRREVRAQIAFLERLQGVVEKLQAEPSSEALQAQINKWMRKYAAAPQHQVLFSARLLHGIKGYLRRHPRRSLP